MLYLYTNEYHGVVCFPYRFAEFLNKPSPELYTSHVWRRTAITWAAEDGLTLPQIRVLSGHRSDSVVQGYIDRSDRMRENIAASVAVSEPCGVVSKMSPSPSLSRSRGVCCDEDLQETTPQSKKQKCYSMQPSSVVVNITNSTLTNTNLSDFIRIAKRNEVLENDFVGRMSTPDDNVSCSKECFLSQEEAQLAAYSDLDEQRLVEEMDSVRLK